MGYYRRWDWEDQLAGGMIGLLVLLAVVVTAVILTVLIILCAELWRIFQARAFGASRSARVLWLALAGVLVVWLVAALVATPAALVVACWAFLVFVLIAELVDLTERKHDPAPAVLPEPTVGDVLGPWTLNPEQPTNVAA